MRLVTRRGILTIAAGAVSALTLGKAATRAQRSRETHGISAFGDLKYPADFKQLDYVNPDAPKGGLFSQIGSNRQFNQNFLTFNSFNSYILKGDARARHGAYLCEFDVGAQPMSPIRCTGWRRARCRFPTTV